MEQITKPVIFLYQFAECIDFIEKHIQELREKFQVHFFVEYHCHPNHKAISVGQYGMGINLFKLKPENWNEVYLQRFLDSMLFVNAKIFLDDVREKPDELFIHLKNFDEFRNFINHYGIPDFISFDHDLGVGKTGYDCAKYLVEQCMNRCVKMPEYKVHSQNPIGKENIVKLLENFRKINV